MFRLNIPKVRPSPVVTDPVTQQLLAIQNTLRLDFGSFKDEFPEQRMAVRYLTGQEKVLEIGGNIGRNSLIIGRILNSRQNANFVTMECDDNIANQLAHNRDQNGLNFIIEPTALSKRNLIQKGWDTIVSDTILPGYKPVATISWEQLVKKYQIQFDTLVLDCEGAFYYILQDMPEILDNIKLLIMENDYWEVANKEYVDDMLKSKGFRVDYREAGGWGPCQSRFFEVWKRI